MPTRQNALHEWLTTILSNAHFTLMPIQSDASFRRYFRVTQGELRYIAMDAPPDKESIGPFIHIGGKLSEIGIHTPAVFAADCIEGFALLEDLGDTLFLKIVNHDNADRLYTSAIDTLLMMQQYPIKEESLPSFDTQVMLKELSLFSEWFIKGYLGLQLSLAEEQLIHDTFQWLADQIKQQPQVFIHRDYHSRNLMIANPKTCTELAVIDFQDAMIGPFTYDLVSLLKDCYIQWDTDKISHWLSYFYNHLPTTHGWSQEEVAQAFHLCGLQRHLKVLGIFCRLHLRDNKSAYLRDLPLTFHYVLACLKNNEDLLPFYRFMQQRVQAPFVKASSV